MCIPCQEGRLKCECERKAQRKDSAQQNHIKKIVHMSGFERLSNHYLCCGTPRQRCVCVDGGKGGGQSERERESKFRCVCVDGGKGGGQSERERANSIYNRPFPTGEEHLPKLQIQADTTPLCQSAWQGVPGSLHRPAAHAPKSAPVKTLCSSPAPTKQRGLQTKRLQGSSPWRP